MDREEYLESVTMNTGIKMNPVESSNIEGIGYDNKNKHLWVAFKGNKVYRYDLVPRKTFEELMNAESKGRYLNSPFWELLFWDLLLPTPIVPGG